MHDDADETRQGGHLILARNVTTVDPRSCTSRRDQESAAEMTKSSATSCLASFAS